jgi:protein gp37
MGETTAISWADHTFNPWIGCQKVPHSPACTHCYAEALADRWWPTERLWHGNRRRTGAANWATPRRWNRDADKFDHRPRVFCASLSDIFEDHPDVIDWRADALQLMVDTPNLDWLLLTKRAENITRMVPDAWLAHWPANIWAGVTVESDLWAHVRLPHLAVVPAPVRFVSAEPVHSLLDLTPWLQDIDWVIAGGESGRHAKPTHPDVFRSLRDQCANARVPFLFKQWGEWDAYGDRVGVRLAGKRLDHLVHEAWPTPRAEVRS